MFYNQCIFKKVYSYYDESNRIETTYVAYIPSKYAILGSVLKIKIDDVWENGWIVDKVGPKMDEKALPDAHAEVKAHRKRTGDSMPKKNLTN